MKTLEQIREQLAAGQVEFSRHGLLRMVERDISISEIQQAGAAAEVIEDYPTDKYSPSALLLGFTAGGRPLHLHVSYRGGDTAKIITLYEPDAAEWIDFRIRR